MSRRYTQRILYRFKYSARVNSIVAHGENGPVDAARVMIVEDSEAIRVSVESALTQAGYTVLARPDGSDLEQRLATFRPDLVVLDVMLPGRDGFALLESIRRHTPVGVVL